MKENELSCKDIMVGDWVSYHGIATKVAPADFCQKKWLEEIKPIPLTPEILEKNGFKKALQVSDTEPFDTDEDGNKHYSYNTTFWGWLQPDNIFCIPTTGLGWLNIKYVHQLQHALRFARIKKEIIL